MSCNAEGLVLGSYQFEEFKSNNDEAFEMRNNFWWGRESEQGSCYSKSVCFARNLENRPGNIATPTHFAKNAENISKASDVKVTVFDRKEFTEMGMGVCRRCFRNGGATKFIIMEYFKGPKSEKPKFLLEKV